MLIVSYSLDAEAAVLGDQIASALKGSQLIVETNLASIMPLGGFDLGIHVDGDDPGLVFSIVAALQQLGNLAVSAQVHPRSPQQPGPQDPAAPPPADVNILVGAKPLKR